ncbi:MAG: hypothetical protein JXR66_05890 [Bacteroidales bacterium]|nr:hypothetical protein [Bacteroidales bacterium]
MKRRLTLVFIVLAQVLFMISCRNDRYGVNISQVKADISIKRLEKDLFTIDPLFLPDSLDGIKKRYGDFLQLFSYVINTGNINDSLFTDHFLGFCTDKLNNEVYNEVITKYPDISELEDEIERAFRHYLWHFPERKVPSVYTCISGFNNSIIISDSILGISLDRYLGRDCRFYPMLEIYSYLAARMNEYNIVPDCMYAWASTEWDFETVGYETDNVIARMIHEGKLKYFAKCMMPEIRDTLLFGFNAGQIDFCINNESQMWAYLIEHDLLFSSDKFVVRKLTGEAPFTSYFTNESPGRAAVWIGFRIVESYMNKNRDVTLAGLMTESNIQAVLDGARYNPR